MKDLGAILMFVIVIVVSLFFFGSLGRAMWLAIPQVSMSPLWLMLTFFLGYSLGKSLAARKAWVSFKNLMGE